MSEDVDALAEMAGNRGLKLVRSRAKSAPAHRPKPEPKPESKLAIRDAGPKDAEAIAALVVALGYEASAADVKHRTAALARAGAHILVADQGGVIGLLTTCVMPVLHRPRPVGRISMMVVAHGRRGLGVGTALVAEAEARLKADGCGLVEVTSNVKLLRAHAFYEKLGYARTSHRFAKPLET